VTKPHVGSGGGQFSRLRLVARLLEDEMSWADSAKDRRSRQSDEDRECEKSRDSDEQPKPDACRQIACLHESGHLVAGLWTGAASVCVRWDRARANAHGPIRLYEQPGVEAGTHFGGCG
jgi:hypothetical protein